MDGRDIDQLVLAAERIRPDVVLVACMEQATDALRRSIGTLRERVRDGIEVELLDFRPEALERLGLRRRPRQRGATPCWRPTPSRSALGRIPLGPRQKGLRYQTESLRRGSGRLSARSCH